MTRSKVLFLSVVSICSLLYGSLHSNEIYYLDITHKKLVPNLGYKELDDSKAYDDKARELKESEKPFTYPETAVRFFVIVNEDYCIKIFKDSVEKYEAYAAANKNTKDFVVAKPIQILFENASLKLLDRIIQKAASEIMPAIKRAKASGHHDMHLNKFIYAMFSEYIKQDLVSFDIIKLIILDSMWFLDVIYKECLLQDFFERDVKPLEILRQIVVRLLKEKKVYETKIRQTTSLCYLARGKNLQENETSVGDKIHLLEKGIQHVESLIADAATYIIRNSECDLDEIHFHLKNLKSNLKPCYFSILLIEYLDHEDANIEFISSAIEFISSALESMKPTSGYSLFNEDEAKTKLHPCLYKEIKDELDDLELSHALKDLFDDPVPVMPSVVPLMLIRPGK